MVLNCSFTKFFLYLTKVLVQDGVQIKQKPSVKIQTAETVLNENTSDGEDPTQTS